jgi:DNA-binding Lrp family transcriptional regulator
MLTCVISLWCCVSMISAYILIEMEPGYIDTSVKDMLKIDKIVKVSVVAGDFDIVVRVQVENLDELHEVTEKIQDVKGIHKTVTQVIEKEIAL